MATCRHCDLHSYANLYSGDMVTPLLYGTAGAHLPCAKIKGDKLAREGSVTIRAGRAGCESLGGAVEARAHFLRAAGL